MAAARLLLLASVAHVHAYYTFTLRAGQSCGFGHYGSPVGSAQRLLVTHLMPGVADWNVAVPMPPICKDTQVTGVDTTVCDADSPPDVVMRNLTSARVHRTGQLGGFAAVNVTVYCVLPTYSLSGHSITTPRQLDNESYSEEVMSDELITNEVISDEAISHEILSNGNGLTSLELMPKVVNAAILSSSSPPPPEDTTLKAELTTPQVELTTPPEKIRPSPETSSHSDEIPQALKVTIKITPSHKSVKKRKPNEEKLPLISNKKKPHEVTSYETPEFSTPYIVTPPQHSTNPPRHRGRPRRHRGRPPRHKQVPAWYTAPPPSYDPAGPPQHDMYPQYTADPPYQAGVPSPRATPAQQYAVPPAGQMLPPVYSVVYRPRMLSPLFRPGRLLRPTFMFRHL